MRFWKSILIAGCLVSVVGLGYAKMAVQADPFSKLFEGNKVFVEGKPSPEDFGRERRMELAKGQHPFATVLTCSDSRVVPEFIFDKGLGEIFVVRVAGNVVEPTTLGSIEYAVEHLHTPLLVIMGHSQCGAVKATLEATGEPEGNIGAILKKIMPAAKAAKEAHKGPDETLDIAVHENIKNTYNDIMKNSEIVKHLVHEGKLKVIGAEYYLASGKAEPIDLAAPWKNHNHN
ncbi:MAG TPA: carbonic anhydrase [Thermodesulfovibrionales bacterium]|nr:carbonic anhydrase [Thermodesulfovibrionales bacterium]